MAKFGQNALTHNLHGQFGDLMVFRSIGGKTVLASPPDRSKLEPTEKQKLQQQHFQEAVLYAKGAFLDTQKKEDYKKAAKPGQGAFSVAVADFLHAPHIDEIDITGYTGQAGGRIRVRAVDDFRVEKVIVTITDPDDHEIEKGKASPEGLDWIYTATANNPGLNGSRIVIHAYDLPGNDAESEKAI
jgi:hypothetical protein